MKRIIAIWLLAAVLAGSLCGCGRIGSLYFSASLSDTYLAAAGRTALTVKESSLIFMDYQNRYNAYYSRTGMDNFWDTELEGATFGTYLKETRIKEEICVLLLLNDMAAQEGIALTEEEEAVCGEAAAAYYGGLSEMERSFCKAQESDIRTLYQKYRRAQKMIAALTEGVYLEISDNDKRVITIQVICTEDRRKAEELHQKTVDGADFQQTAKENSSLSRAEYQVSRGMLNPVLEETAFYLADGEISDVIEADGNYYIIKCIDDFDESLSMANEDNIYRRTLYEQWRPALEAYAAEHEVSFQEKLWSSMTFYETTAVTADNLYDVYNRYFSEAE